MGVDAQAGEGDGAALESLRDVGRLLSALKEPEPPKGLKDAGKLFSLAKAVWDMAPKTVSAPPCQESSGKATTWTSPDCRFRPAGRAMPAR